MRGRYRGLLSGENTSRVHTPRGSTSDTKQTHSPSSVEELQAALKVVNEFKIPVWTVSRGKNLG